MFIRGRFDNFAKVVKSYGCDNEIKVSASILHFNKHRTHVNIFTVGLFRDNDLKLKWVYLIFTTKLLSKQ